MKEERFCEYLENLIHVPIIRMNADGQIIEKEHVKAGADFYELLQEKVKEVTDGVGIVKADEYSIYAVVEKSPQEYLLIGPVWASEERERTGTKVKAYECKFMTLIEAAFMLYEYCTGKEKDVFQFIQNEISDEYKKMLEQKRTE